MEKEMEAKLPARGDLRMIGYGHLYEQYPLMDVKGFYERFLKGEKIKTNWMNPDDYEKMKLKD
jgi:N-sulfoglucosamine sulfohydrolase